MYIYIYVYMYSPNPHQSQTPNRCRQNMAYVRYSMPDFGLGFHVKELQPFLVVPFLFGNGRHGSDSLWCRGTSLIRNCPSPWNRHRSLGMVLQ